MRITFLAPCKDLSGGIKIIATYAQMLQERGHLVSVLYPPKKQSLRRKLKLASLKTLGFQKDHLDHFKGQLRAVEKVNDLTVPDGDILVATAWETAEWARTLSSSKGRKFYFIQGHEVWNAQQDRVYATYQYPMQKITISAWLEKLVAKISGDENIHLIPNGVDERFRVKESASRVRQYDVGLVYSSIPNKGCHLGIDALKTLSKSQPHLQFAIFGTEAPTEKLPANTTVFVRPSQKKIAQIYQKTKVWLSSSYEEGFCLPCLEAMSSGCAVVSTDNRGVRDILEHGSSGYVTLRGRSDGLSQLAEMILNDVDLLNRISRNAIQRSKLFSWQRSVLAFEGVLSAKIQTEAA